MRNAWLNTLFKIAHKNKKIIFMGSDLGANVMEILKKNFHKDFLWKEYLNRILLELQLVWL